MKNEQNSLTTFFDTSVPYVIIVLLAIIILEFGFKPYLFIHQYFLSSLDKIMIIFLVADLVFKYSKKPFKLKWLDVLSLYPFYLLYRIKHIYREPKNRERQMKTFLKSIVRTQRLLKAIPFYCNTQKVRKKKSQSL
ncbi:hypothetical protein HN419_01485 [Candidatus Woesearchaeota archaeon]|nr:hypothetical protein [Candidatus Woesearchaeota archaeon]MBT3537331.1 hypothetical protein [Candidatus Woesearchaeota archaeon]MBT4697399.1 hypothetical protein [Candidatus Woesearchaeota archaeon]MBT4716703.1 hypothetical protein [Candidatus Woesearchaeota archaeon]MBT7106359.1 hypothetical protein [Candidatus Woesearchaeota archaeon]